MSTSIKISRSCTFSIPGTSFAPQKIQIDLSKTIMDDQDVDLEQVRAELTKQLSQMLFKEATNHVADVMDIVTAPDIDSLMDYLEKSIEENNG